MIITLNYKKFVKINFLSSLIERLLCEKMNLKHKKLLHVNNDKELLKYLDKCKNLFLLRSYKFKEIKTLKYLQNTEVVIMHL